MTISHLRKILRQKANSENILGKFLGKYHGKQSTKMDLGNKLVRYHNALVARLAMQLEYYLMSNITTKQCLQYSSFIIIS